MARSRDEAIRNEVLFRDANERIAEVRDDLDAVHGATPFICECEDEACTAIIRMAPDDYGRVRANPVFFVIVPGHPTIGEETGLQGDGWVCVTKEGKL